MRDVTVGCTFGREIYPIGERIAPRTTELLKTVERGTLELTPTYSIPKPPVENCCLTKNESKKHQRVT